MSAVWLLALAVFFGYLAYDAFQFRHSSSHFVWAVPPGRRAIGVDPLSVEEQCAASSNEYTGAQGVPGLHWVFVLMAVVCAGSGIYLWIFE